ncbi:apoptotic protease-activating factor 1 [Protopterus annectens]|uniref:apoptotic protease-activating factor 1 n=1 Tax=Protopterus annectens TaxID=7888 RepID=UPI001CFA5122|nr:apoptotic protease-activating factor 1 [Protopterus annectens]
MDEKARSCLLQNRYTLERDIKTSYIMDHMISDEVLKPHEEQKVRALATQRERGAMLIDIILKKDNYAFISFYNALLHEGYKDLAAVLQDCIPLISPEPEKGILDGVTPYDSFPGGVHWLSVGKQDKAGLLLKLQNLCIRLENDSQLSQRPPINIEEARDRLRLLMVRKYPRSLLILDDVWDSWALKAFDIQCRVLITSRNRTVAESVTGKRYSVHVEEGLSHGKGLEVLARFVNKKTKELPEQAHNIVNECKGSPLVVSLIGALLREFPHRWEYYLRQLQNKQFKRIRKSSSYDYEALDEAMSISIDVLNDDHKEYYKFLSVLEKDVKIPAKVLSLLWDMETEDAEDVLQVFVNKSLLSCDRNGNSFLYYLHDLQLDFLTEQNRNRLPELHSKMVRQYQKYYKENPPGPEEEDCMYWYNFLAYHMAKGNMHKELYQLMFSLDWIKDKTQLMGPAHLISEFVEYQHILDLEDKFVRNNFQEFLCLNGHLLAQKPLPDIFQLGLCQPNSSEVYRQAKLQAEKAVEKRAFYVDWINRNSLQSLCRMVFRPHADTVYHACFSQDGQKIASCGSDRTVQVFRSDSGGKFLEISAHDDTVLCCDFSADDKLLATCSADKKVKVWNSLTGKLLRIYDEHLEQVNHCQFNNTEGTVLLATCSEDTYVKLWDLDRECSRNSLIGHTKSVNHCRFSPDDKYLASCSVDGTLWLWDVSSANSWKTINVEEAFRATESDCDEVEVFVKCCAWSSDSERLMAATKNIIFIFDVTTGNLLSEIKTSRHSTIQYCDFCPVSQLIAVALSHFSIELWNAESCKRVADCKGHLSWVHSVRFSPDGARLLSASDDHTVRLWEANKVYGSSSVSLKREVDVLFQHNDIIVLAPDSRNQVQLIDGIKGEVLGQSEPQNARIRSCCIHRSGQLASLGCQDGTVKGGIKSAKQVLKNIGVWTLQILTPLESCLIAVGLDSGTVKVLDMPSGQTRGTTKHHTKSVQCCQFTQDGQHVITSSDDGTIQVWNWETQASNMLIGHKEPVKNFKLLRNSQLLSWSFDGTVKVWDLNTSEIIQDIVCHSEAILSCDVIPDGSKFASVSADKTAKIWSFEGAACLHVLRGHKSCVRSCRFSWDAQYLATGDDDGEIRVWNVNSGSLCHICPQECGESVESRHGGWVTDLHFSPDSKILMSAGGFIRWWNVDTGVLLQTFYTIGSYLKKMHVSSNFQTYVTIDNNGILYVLKRIE